MKYLQNTGCASDKPQQVGLASRLSVYLPVIFIAFSGIFLAAVMGSCVILNEADNKDKPEYPEDAYITLAIGTRTDRPDGDPGDYNERKVGRVRMVLYSTNKDPQSATPADYEVVRAFTFLIESKDEGSNGTFVPGYEEWDPLIYELEFDDSGYPEGKHLYDSTSDESDDYFITWARQVPRRDYKMLILVNADDSFGPNVTRSKAENTKVCSLTDPGRRMSEFLAAASTDTEQRDDLIKIVNTKHGFVMTNSMGFVDIPAASLATSEEGAHANPFAVAVDRVVAKVKVTGDPTAWEVPDGVTLGDVRWDIHNFNKKFYWMRKQTNIIDHSWGPAGVGELETDVYPDPYGSGTKIQRGSIYAEDPNFEGISGDDSLVKANFIKADVYNYGMRYRLNPDGEFDFEYVLENTMVGAEQHEDVMTSVVVSVEYFPAGFREGYGYFQYNGIVMTEETALDYYWGKTAIPDGLTGIVEAMRSASETVDYVDNSGYRIYLLYIYEDYLSASRGFSHQGLNYYHEGKCYYNIPIHHSGNAGSGDETRYFYGNYGVVRNNIYNISIDGIKGPGSPEIGGKGNISAKISIVDWSTHDETIVDVGEEVN